GTGLLTTAPRTIKANAAAVPARLMASTSMPKTRDSLAPEQLHSDWFSVWLTRVNCGRLYNPGACGFHRIIVPD
ncbi:MAG TPA: hypothetical protein VLN59_13465, partial [Burkholderiales bacterium]|nr:hypothetical protein [Burkholderiales bacterium]